MESNSDANKDNSLPHKKPIKSPKKLPSKKVIKKIVPKSSASIAKPVPAKNLPKLRKELIDSVMASNKKTGFNAPLVDPDCGQCLIERCQGVVKNDREFMDLEMDDEVSQTIPVARMKAIIAWGIENVAEYVTVHIDGDLSNHSIDNLGLLPIEEVLRFYGYEKMQDKFESDEEPSDEFLDKFLELEYRLGVCDTEAFGSITPKTGPKTEDLGNSKDNSGPTDFSGHFPVDINVN